MTSSGSAVSAKAVNPRRSAKTTVTSRRWVRSGSSAPPWTMASASCGEKKRLSRPSRSSCSDLRLHAALQCAVPLAERRRLLLDRVVERLDPEHRLHPRHQRRLVDRLREVLVRAGVEPGHDVPRSRPSR